ncbi:MAG: hypothetical protein R2716_06935 [Microthrixaceae bacterium]
MASLLTEITEVTTGLGTLGAADPSEALGAPSPPGQLEGVGESTWRQLREAWDERLHQGAFLAAFNNGRAFLRSQDALRGRVPARVEWRGPHRDPSDHPVPADLRIDHVYLVSCKYLSKVLHNASPWALFERCLTGDPTRRGGDWYAEVAPVQHQHHYEELRRIVAGGERLPQDVTTLGPEDRAVLLEARDATSERTAAAYAELAAAVAVESARRWNAALDTPARRRSMLWRLLRLNSAPYFVLGTGSGRNLRIRVATPWDWTRSWDLEDLEIAPEVAGQPRVSWTAGVRSLMGSGTTTVRGHVEIRWSHGRLGGSPEAKVYLDTPHREVPGYVELS